MDFNSFDKIDQFNSKTNHSAYKNLNNGAYKELKENDLKEIFLISETDNRSKKQKKKDKQITPENKYELTYIP